MASLLDLTKERDAHIDKRLRENVVIWVASVRADGRPHAAVVWFLWDGESFLIFSRPHAQKVRNLRQNAHVLVIVDDSDEGEDPITIEGTAELLEPGKVDATKTGYLEKYREGIKEIGFTPEQMAAEYSQAIRITPTRVV